MLKKLFFLFLTLALVWACNSSSQKTAVRSADLSQTSAKKINRPPGKTPTASYTPMSDTSTAQYVEEQGIFADTALNFKIWFPQKPVTQVETLSVYGYSIPYYTFMYQQPEDFLYLVGVQVFPKQMLDKYKAKDILYSSVNGVIHTFHLQLAYTKPYVYNGLQAIEYKAHAGRLYLTGLNVLNGRYLYQLVMLMHDEYADDLAVHDFIGSFKLLNPSAL